MIDIKFDCIGVEVEVEVEIEVSHIGNPFQVGEILVTENDGRIFIFPLTSHVAYKMASNFEYQRIKKDFCCTLLRIVLTKSSSDHN